MLCGRRPSRPWDDAVREDLAGSIVAARLGPVIGFSGRNRATELLREQIGEIWPAHAAGERARQIRQIAGTVCKRRDRDQPGVDALSRTCALIVPEVENFVFLERTANGSSELILVEKAAIRREEVAGVQVGVPKELERRDM